MNERNEIIHYLLGKCGEKDQQIAKLKAVIESLRPSPSVTEPKNPSENAGKRTKGD